MFCLLAALCKSVCSTYLIAKLNGNYITVLAVFTVYLIAQRPRGEPTLVCSCLCRTVSVHAALESLSGGGPVSSAGFLALCSVTVRSRAVTGRCRWAGGVTTVTARHTAPVPSVTLVTPGIGRG